MPQLSDKDRLRILMDSIKVEHDAAKELQRQRNLEENPEFKIPIPQPIFIDNEKKEDNVEVNETMKIVEKRNESDDKYLDGMNTFRYLFPDEYKTNVNYFRSRLQQKDAVELLGDISFGYKLENIEKKCSNKLYSFIAKLKSFILHDINENKIFSLLNCELEEFGEIVDISQVGIICINELLPIDIVKEKNVFKIKDILYTAENVYIEQELIRLYELVLAIKSNSLFHLIKYASMNNESIVEELLRIQYPTVITTNLLLNKKLLKINELQKDCKYFEPEEIITLLLVDSYNFVDFISRLSNNQNVELPMAKISELNRKSLLSNIPDKYALYLHNHIYPFIETLIMQEDLQLALDDYASFRQMLKSPTSSELFVKISKFVCDSINARNGCLKIISYLLDSNELDLDTIEVSNVIDFIGINTAIKIGIGNKECITAFNDKIQRFTWDSNIGKILRNIIALSTAIKEKDILSILYRLAFLEATTALKNTHDLLKTLGCELPNIIEDKELILFYKKLNPNSWLEIEGFSVKEIIKYDTTFDALDYKLLMLMNDRETTTYLYKKYMG